MSHAHGHEAPPLAAAGTAPGCLQLALDQPARAASLASAALQQQDEDARQRLIATACLARAQLMQGQGQQAVDTIHALYAELEQAHGLPPRWLRRAQLQAAWILSLIGSPDEVAQARDVFVATTLQARAEHDRALEAEALTDTAAYIANRLHDDGVSISYLRQAARLSGPSGPFPLVNTYFQLRIEIEDVQFEQARQLLQQLRQHLATSGAIQPGLQLRLDTAQAQVALLQQQPITALPLLQRTLSSQRLIRDVLGEQATLLAMGLAESYQNHLPAAMDYSRQALSLARTAHIDLIPSLHQLLDIAIKAQNRAAIHEYGSQLMALGSRVQRHQWKNQLQDIEARLSPPEQAPAVRSEPAPAPAPPHPHWLLPLVGLSLLIGCSGLGLAWQQRRLLRRRLRQNMLDPLCQVLTRRETCLRIDRLAALPTAGPLPAPLLLLLIDVDHFKSINDQYGHVVGDEVLAEVAGRLRRSCREQDVLGRWGGEEFLIAGLSLDPLAAERLSQRICRAVTDRPILTRHGHALQLSVSIGTTWWPFIPSQTPSGHWRDALLPADTALYAVKRSGRNGWASLQGTAAARLHSLDSLLQDPQRAEQEGLLIVHSSLALHWSAAIAPAA